MWCSTRYARKRALQPPSGKRRGYVTSQSVWMSRCQKHVSPWGLFQFLILNIFCVLSVGKAICQAWEQSDE